MDNRSESRDKQAAQRNIAARVEIIRQVVYIGFVFYVFGIIFDVVDYLWLSGPWQLLGEMALSVFSIVLLAWALRVVQEGTEKGCDGAGYMILLTLLINFVVGKALWKWGLVVDVVTGIVLPIVVGIAVLPRRWYFGLLLMLLDLAYHVLLSRSAPTFQYRATEYTGRYPVLDWMVISLPVLLIVRLALVAYSRVASIRTKLIIFSIALVTGTSITILLGEVAVGFKTGRERSLAQLESVAVLKESQIESRFYSLQNELVTLSSGESLRYSRITLRGNVSAGDELYSQAVSNLRAAFEDTVRREQELKQIFLVDSSGKVVVSTDEKQVGRNYKGYTFFKLGLKGPNVHLTMDGGLWLDIVTPVMDKDDTLIGVLTARSDLAVLDEMMAFRTESMGDTGETYLISAERAPLTSLKAVERLPYLQDAPPYSTIVTERQNFSGIYTNYAGETVIGVYRWVPDLSVALVAEQSLAEAEKVIFSMVFVNGVVTLGTIIVAVIIALFITDTIVSPLSDLARKAEQVAGGNLSLVVEVTGEDEIGALGRAFNNMTARIRQLVSSLEQQVAERTGELERRSKYLEASADVGRAASSILDPDLLIRQVVNLIQERFDLYYVGLFLTDGAGEWAVLRAGTGEAGQKMLARHHRIRVGEGMIGWSIANARARVAFDVGEDGVRLATRELPDTRSEAALPLRSRDRVIGALTVQSDRPGAFDEETIAVLQMMADLVAVALDNARLYTESQTALEAARRAYGEKSREAWARLLRARQDIAYRSDDTGVASVPDLWLPEMERALRKGEVVRTEGADRHETLAIPIRVRDSVVGVLNTYKPSESGGWTDDEIALLRSITDRLGMALDSARLYEEAQRLALRERLTREITDKMRRATTIEAIVQTVVDELFNVLNPSRTFVKLGPEVAGDTETEG